MRRPCFRRWIRREVLRIAGAQRFNLRAFAAQAQSNRRALPNDVQPQDADARALDAAQERDGADCAAGAPRAQNGGSALTATHAQGSGTAETDMPQALSASTSMPASAQAQGACNDALAAALILYAYENDCLPRLKSLLYDEALIRECDSVTRHFGKRSLERLALRGTPMMSIPPLYRALLSAFEQAYHTPERLAAEKRTLGEEAQAAVLRTGESPAALARELGIDRANLNAFLTRGEPHRFNLETARRIASATTRLIA